MLAVGVDDEEIEAFAAHAFDAGGQAGLVELQGNFRQAARFTKVRQFDFCDGNHLFSP